MEKEYWLKRERASVRMADNAATPEARLIHFDLAGRYSLKALFAENQAVDVNNLRLAGDLTALSIEL